MSEQFQGKGRSLIATDSCAHLVLHSLSVIIDSSAPATLDEMAVKHFVRICRDQSDGWRNFRIYPAPEPVASVSSQRFFSEKIATLAELLLFGPLPKLLQERFLDKNDRFYFAAFLAELHDLQRESGWSVERKLEPFFHDADDESRFLLKRLAIRRTDIQRRNDLQAEAEILEAIIRLETKLSTASWTLFFERAEVLEKLSRVSEAVVVLREGAKAAELPEGRASLLAYAKKLESEKAVR